MATPARRVTTSRYARAVVRLRWAIVAGWIALAVAAVQLLPSLDEAQTGALGDLVPADSEAVDAELRAFELFAFPVLSRTLMVQRDAEGLNAFEQARVVRRAVALNQDDLPGLEAIAGAIPVTNALGAPPFARERSTTAITYLLFSPEVGRGEREAVAERLAAAVARREGHFVGITGALPARDAQAEAIQDALPWVELATVAIVALAVGLHFRALPAPLVTLVAVAIAYLVSIRLMAGVGERLGISVPAEVEPVVVVLLFGVLTDYAIFFLSRLRRRLAEGEAARAAAEGATAELQGIVLTAGLTVAAGSASLVVADLGFFQAFGPGLALAVLVALAVALTFIPAALAILGRTVLWPSDPRRARRGGWRRRLLPALRRALSLPAGLSASVRGTRRSPSTRRHTLSLPARRPALVAGATTLALLACAAGLTQLDVGQTLIRGLPPEAEARRAYVAASRGFAPGILSPTVVLVEGRGITRRRDALARLQALIARRANVAQVVGPRQSPAAQPFGVVLSRTGNAARLFVVLGSDPLGAGAIRTLRALQRDLPELTARAGLGGRGRIRVSLAGDTALAAETVTKASGDLGRIAPAVLLAVTATLAVFLRALIAPLYLVAGSVLALAAALGLTTVVAKELLGWPELTFFVPFAAAVLLVSLGSDYNVFLAGRVWQEARGRALRDAVSEAGARAAAAIGVAGIVLALSFAVLALVPIRAFRELALAMALGLLIDAFLVRTLLLPALIVLVGPRSGWPGQRLADRLPEPAIPVSPRTPADAPVSAAER